MTGTLIGWLLGVLNRMCDLVWCTCSVIVGAIVLGCAEVVDDSGFSARVACDVGLEAVPRQCPDFAFLRFQSGCTALLLPARRAARD